MFGFIFFTFLLLGAIALILAPAFLAKINCADNADSFHDFYGAELHRLDREVAAGRLDQQLAVETRHEIARRFKNAQKSVKNVEISSSPALPALFIYIFIFLSVGSVGTYVFLGAPAMQDLPRAERLATAQILLENRASQKEVEARFSKESITPKGQEGLILRDLRAKVNQQKDAMGYRLLGQLEAQYGNYQTAHQNWGAYLDILENPTSDNYAYYAMLLRFAARGYISPASEKAARVALAKEPKNAIARDIMATLYLQNDRPDLAFVIWKKLIDENTELSTVKITQIKSQLQLAAIRAGIRYEPDFE